MSDRASLEVQLQRARRFRDILLEQKAASGLQFPANLVIELEQKEAEIERIEDELRRLGGGESDRFGSGPSSSPPSPSGVQYNIYYDNRRTIQAGGDVIGGNQGDGSNLSGTFAGEITSGDRESSGEVAFSPSANNPFICGPTVSPDRFYGRKRAIADLKSRVGAVSPQSINLVGMRRIGKSSLLRYLRERVAEFCQQALVVNIDLSDRKFHTPEGITEGLRRGIGRFTGEQPWGQECNGDPFEIEDCLVRLRDEGYRLLVLLDEFEAIAQRLEAFQDWGDDWRSKGSAGLLTMVVASKRPIYEIYSDVGCTSPFANIFTTTYLGSLEADAREALLRDGLGKISDRGRELAAQLAGGFPFYLQMAGSMLWSSPGDLEGVRSRFLDQAMPQFRMLWREFREPEQRTLQALAGVPGKEASPEVVRELQKYGIVEGDNRLFSREFEAFVRGDRR